MNSSVKTTAQQQQQQRTSSSATAPANTSASFGGGPRAWFDQVSVLNVISGGGDRGGPDNKSTTTTTPSPAPTPATSSLPQRPQTPQSQRSQTPQRSQTQQRPQTPTQQFSQRRPSASTVVVPVPNDAGSSSGVTATFSNAASAFLKRAGSSFSAPSSPAREQVINNPSPSAQQQQQFFPIARLPSLDSIEQANHNDSNHGSSGKRNPLIIIKELRQSNARLTARMADMEAEFINQLTQQQFINKQQHQDAKDKLQLIKQQYELTYKLIQEKYREKEDQLQKVKEESAFQRHTISDLKTQLQVFQQEKIQQQNETSEIRRGVLRSNSLGGSVPSSSSSPSSVMNIPRTTTGGGSIDIAMKIQEANDEAKRERLQRERLEVELNRLQQQQRSGAPPTSPNRKLQQQQQPSADEQLEQTRQALAESESARKELERQLDEHQRKQQQQQSSTDGSSNDTKTDTTAREESSSENYSTVTENLQQQLADRDETIQELQSHVLELEQELSQTLEQMTDLIRQHETEEQYRRDEADDLRVLNDAQEEELDLLKQQLEDARKEIELRDQVLEEKKTEDTDDPSPVGTTTNTDFDNSTPSSLQAVQDQQNQQLLQELESTKHLVERLEQELDDVRADHADEVTNWEDTVDDLRRALQEMEQDNQELFEELQALRQHQQQQQQDQTKDDAITELTAKFQALSGTVKLLETKLLEKQTELEELQQTRKEAQQDLVRQYETRIADLEHEKSTLEKVYCQKWDNVKAQLDTIKKETAAGGSPSRAADVKVVMASRVEQLQEEKIRLKQEMAQLKEQLSTLEEQQANEKHLLEEEIAALKLELQKEKAKQQQQETEDAKERSKLEEQISQVQEQLLSENSRLNDELSELNEQLQGWSKLDEELSKLREELRDKNVKMMHYENDNLQNRTKEAELVKQLEAAKGTEADLKAELIKQLEAAKGTEADLKAELTKQLEAATGTEADLKAELSKQSEAAKGTEADLKAELTKQLEAAKGKEADLLQQLETLKETEAKTQQELQELVEKNKKEMGELTEKLEDRDTTISSLVKSTVSLEQELSTTRQELIALRNRATTIRGVGDDTNETGYDVILASSTISNDEAEGLRAALEETKEAERRLNDECDNLQELLEEARQANANMRAQVDSYKSEITFLRSQVDEDEVKSFNGSGVSMGSLSPQNQIQERDRAIASLVERAMEQDKVVADLHRKLGSMTQEVQALRARAQSGPSWEEVKELRRETEMFAGQVIEQDEEIEELKEVLRVRERRIASLEIEIEEMKCRAPQSPPRRPQTPPPPEPVLSPRPSMDEGSSPPQLPPRHAIVSLHPIQPLPDANAEKVIQLSAEIDELTEANNTLRDELRKLRKTERDYEASSVQMDLLKHQVQARIGEIHELKSTIDKLFVQKQELMDKLKEYQGKERSDSEQEQDRRRASQTIQFLNSKKLELEATVSELRAKPNFDEMEMENLQNQIENLQISLEHQNDALLSAKDTIRELESLLAEKNADEAAALDDEKEELLLEVENLQSQLQQAQDELKQLDQQRAIIDDFKMKLESADEAREESEKLIVDTYERKLKLLTMDKDITIDNLRKDLTEQKQISATETGVLTNKIRHYEAEMNKMRQEMTREIEEREERLVAVQHTLSAHEQLVSRMKIEMDHLQGSMENNVVNRREEIDCLQHEVADLSDTILKQEREIKALKGQLSDEKIVHELEVAKFKETLESLQAAEQNSEHRNALDLQMAIRLKEVKDRLEKLKWRNSSLNEENVILRDRLQKAESSLSESAAYKDRAQSLQRELQQQKKVIEELSVELRRLREPPASPQPTPIPPAVTPPPEPSPPLLSTTATNKSSQQQPQPSSQLQAANNNSSSASSASKDNKKSSQSHRPRLGFLGRRRPQDV